MTVGVFRSFLIAMGLARRPAEVYERVKVDEPLPAYDPNAIDVIAYAWNSKYTEQHATKIKSLENEVEQIERVKFLLLNHETLFDLVLQTEFLRWVKRGDWKNVAELTIAPYAHYDQRQDQAEKIAKAFAGTYSSWESDREEMKKYRSIEAGIEQCTKQVSILRAKIDELNKLKVKHGTTI